MKAFPQSNDTVINTMLNRDNNADPEGMDLRDYFAAKAMQAILSKLPLMSESGNYGEKMSGNDILIIHDNVSYTAYSIADSMMETRK